MCFARFFFEFLLFRITGAKRRAQRQGGRDHIGAPMSAVSGASKSAMMILGTVCARKQSLILLNAVMPASPEQQLDHTQSTQCIYGCAGVRMPKVVMTMMAQNSNKR
jgi:hypothetical protein